MVVLGGHIMQITLNMCFCGERWCFIDAIIPQWDLRSALHTPSGTYGYSCHPHGPS